MKKVAIIGVTGFGRNHLGHLSRLADSGLMDLAAAVVRTPARAQKELETLNKFNCKIYSTADELFAAEQGKIDLVCIPTGINSHESLTCKAVAAGMNVLLEKPAAGSVAAVDRMIAAQRPGLFTAVAFQHCYAPEIIFIKKLLTSGRLGKILGSKVMGIWPRGDDYYSRNVWVAHRTAPDGELVLDSPVNNAFAHYLNLLLFLNGRSESASAHAVSVEGDLMRARPGIEMFDSCEAVFSLEDGRKLEILLAHCSDHQMQPHLKIQCENALIDWDLNTSAWSVTAADGKQIAAGTMVTPNEGMFRQILSKLEDPLVPCYTLENAREHTNCIELLDHTCRIRDVKAEREPEKGVWCVPGLPEHFVKRFEEPLLP